MTIHALQQTGIRGNDPILPAVTYKQAPKKRDASIRSKREPVEAGIRTPIFITREGTIEPLRDKQTPASNIDIAPTILRACGIEPPAAMTGLDLRDPEFLARRNRAFVDFYQHDSELSRIDDIGHGLVARVVVDGWDKLIATPGGRGLYNLRTDPDDRRNLAAEKPEKTAALSGLIADWMEHTPPHPAD